MENTNCPLPCTYMTVEIATLKDVDDNEYNWGSLIFSKKVDINTDINNYDEFALLVEVGSSLGIDIQYRWTIPTLYIINLI